MDSELKRRLVGTIIIVSLVVIFVPMLFEEKDDLSQDSRETSIPDFPKDFESQVIPLPEGTPEAKSSKEAGAEPPEEPYVAPAARRDDSRDPLDVPPRKSPETTKEESAAQQPAAESEDEEDFPKPPAKPAPVPAKPAPPSVAPVTKPAAKPSSEAVAKPAKAAAEPAPAVKAPSPEALAPRPVKKKTVTTTALPKSSAPDKTVHGGAAREAPEGGQARPVKQEFKPVPTAPQPSADKTAPAAPLPGATPAGEAARPAKEPANLTWWMIQAGSFDDEANARNLKTRLLQAKIPAFSEKITAPNGVVKYRVRVGPEKERAKAEEILKRMESEAGVKGMIVSYP